MRGAVRPLPHGVTPSNTVTGKHHEYTVKYVLYIGLLYCSVGLLNGIRRSSHRSDFGTKVVAILTPLPVRHISPVSVIRTKVMVKVSFFRVLN